MDDIAKLITEGIATYDSMGNPRYTRTETEVFVREDSVTRSEYYAAAQAGLKPEIVLILSDYMDYAGQTLIEYHGEEFTIIRAYRRRNTNELELILERKTENLDDES